MSELVKRILSAVVLIPLALFVVLWDNTLPFAACMFLIAVVGNKEMANLFTAKGLEFSKPAVYAGAFVIPVSFYFTGQWHIFVYVLVGLVFFSFLAKMFTVNPTEGVISFVGTSILGAVFFPFFISFLWLIRGLENGQYWILFLFAAIWLSDSCAYFVGRKFGTVKIVPKISPKKSLQGYIAGVIAGTAGSVFFYYSFLHYAADISMLKIVIVAVDVVAAGILGDLFESMLKRDAGVKDSGTLIPGHGGALDRFDSILMSAPVLYMYLSVWL